MLGMKLGVTLTVNKNIFGYFWETRCLSATKHPRGGGGTRKNFNRGAHVIFGFEI